MTEYVPTTDEMRNVYASVQALGIRSGPPGAIEYNHGKAKFDRWLDEIRAEAWDEGYNSSGANQANHENWMCGVISKEDLQKRYRANPYRPTEK